MSTPNLAADRLRAERDEALAAIQRVWALHQPREIDVLSAECCTEACDHEDECPTRTSVCAECLRVGESATPYPFEEGGLPIYPCPTIRALDGAS